MVCASCSPGSTNETFAVVVDSSTLKKISISSGIVSTIDDVELSYYGVAISPDGLYCLASVQFQDRNHGLKRISLLNYSYIYPKYSLLSEPAFSATFDSPVGISIAVGGTFALVADSSGKITKIDLLQNLVILSIAGLASGSALSAYQDGPGTSAAFNYPMDVNISPDGIYALVADSSNHRIRKIDLSSATAMVSTLAGNTQGYIDGNEASFSFPNSVAISSDGVFALVADSNNHAIRKIPLLGETIVTTVAGGSPGFQDGIDAKFTFPKGISISIDGKYAFVADSGNKAIRKIDLASYFVVTLSDYIQGNLGESFIGPQLMALAPPGTCSFCEKGTYSDGTWCSACEAGTYSTTLGAGNSLSCKLCNASKASSHIGGSDSSVCQSCRAGEFSLEGSSSCEQCKAGKFSSIGSTTCIICIAGTFSDSNATSACADCAQGTFSTVLGATGSALCSSCDSGKFSSALGAADSSVCRSCDPGQFFYNTHAGTSCVPCAAGTFASIIDAIDSNNCSGCSAGSYSTVVGATSETVCDRCGAGKYSVVAGTQCVSCQAGQFSLDEAADCSNCGSGSYSWFSAASACTLCSGGKYSKSGQSSCLMCAPGLFSSINGSTTCKVCSAGTYSSVAASTGCMECAAGKFLLSGSSMCEFCSLGKYSSSVAASSCVACEPGKYSDLAGSNNESQCAACGRGHFSTTLGANISDCRACGFGTYSVSEVSTACLACTTCHGGVLMGCNSTDNAVCQSYPEATDLSGRFLFAFGPVPLAGCAALAYVKFHSVPLLPNIRWIYNIYVGTSNVLFNFALLVLLSYAEEREAFWIVLGSMTMYIFLCVGIYLIWRESFFLLVTSSTDIKPHFSKSIAISNKILAIFVAAVPSLIIQIWLLVQFWSTNTSWTDWLIWIQSVLFALCNLMKNTLGLKQLSLFDPKTWEANEQNAEHDESQRKKIPEFVLINEIDHSSKDDSCSEPISTQEQETRRVSTISERRNANIEEIGEISIEFEPVSKFDDIDDSLESSPLRSNNTPKKKNIIGIFNKESSMFSMQRSPFEPDFEHAVDLIPPRIRKSEIPLVAEESSPSKRKAE